MRFLSPAALVRPPVPSVAECRGEVPHFDFFFAALFFVDFLADRFVAMWVNDLTLDYTERGREAVARLLSEGFERGIIPNNVTVEFTE